MKTSSTKPTSESGSVLIVIMGIVAVAALVLGSYFMMVQNQASSVARSQIWNSVIPVTEAGLEEGMQLVNKNAGVTGATQWEWTNSMQSDGWSAFSNNITTLTRSVNGVGSYTVSIDISPAFIAGQGPQVYASGTVTYQTVPFVFGMMRSPFLAQLGGNTGSTTTTQNMGRKVSVATVPVPLFTAAVITKSNFDMKGNKALVDSFDSSDTNYSTTNGLYTVFKRKASGDVATDSSIVDSLNIGQGNIYGHVMTGPGTVQTAVQVGSQGAVGDAAWNASSANRGKIQPGYWAGDFNVNIPDVNPPTGLGSPQALPGASNGWITLTGGYYSVGANPGSPIKVAGPSTLWVQGSFSRNILITNNASLVLYVGTTNAAGSDSIDLSGQGNINYPGLADKLQIYGLPSLTSIDFTGNSGFAGTIYAPEAALRGGGGGSSDLDTSGAIIVQSVRLNGHWNFHYDEHLKVSGPSRGWIPKSWTEQRASN